VAQDPRDVRLFRATAVVADTKSRANAIEQARPRWSGRAALMSAEREPPATAPRRGFHTGTGAWTKAGHASARPVSQARRRWVPVAQGRNSDTPDGRARDPLGWRSVAPQGDAGTPREPRRHQDRALPTRPAHDGPRDAVVEGEDHPGVTPAIPSRADPPAEPPGLRLGRLEPQKLRAEGALDRLAPPGAAPWVARRRDPAPRGPVYLATSPSFSEVISATRPRSKRILRSRDSALPAVPAS
jgi:hypothetical protein